MEFNEIWTADRQALALAEAERWRGTPHRHRIASLGRGIDCIRFVVKVMIAAGVVDDTTIPTYPTAWGLASAENKIAAAFMACCEAVRIPMDEWEPEFGDVCIWACGQNSNHVGIYLGRDVWHVSTNSPAGPLMLATARKRMQEAVRLVRPGWTSKPETLRLLNL